MIMPEKLEQENIEYIGGKSDSTFGCRTMFAFSITLIRSPA